MWLVYWMSLQAGEKIVGFVKGKLFFSRWNSIAFAGLVFYETWKIYYMKMFNFDRIMKVHIVNRGNILPDLFFSLLFSLQLPCAFSMYDSLLKACFRSVRLEAFWM